MIPQHRQIDEPDVTPLINVNLVVLVMVVIITSSATRLLPLAVPKVDAEAQGRNVSLTVTEAAYEFRTGQGGMVLGGPEALAAVVAEQGQPADGWVMTVADGQLDAAAAALDPGSTVTLTLAEGAGRDRLGRAVNSLRRAGEVQVVLDDASAVPLTVRRDSYDFAGRTGLDGDALAEAVADLQENSIVLIRLDGKAKYDRLVQALAPILARGDVRVVFRLEQP